MIKRQFVEALDNSLRPTVRREDRHIWWRFQTGSSHSSERVKGSGGQCLGVYVEPLGFHATSKTSAQHEGKEQPVVCRILVACPWRI
jgi:hypothetical protein